MKKTAILLLYFFFVTSLKGQIQPEPARFSRIISTYYYTSNIQFDSEGIYCDSISLKVLFPLKTIQTIQSKTDPNETIGFIPMSELDVNEKGKACLFIYDHSKKIVVKYLRKRNLVLIETKTGINPELIESLKNDFAIHYIKHKLSSNFFMDYYKLKYKYKKNNKCLMKFGYPISRRNKVDGLGHKITWVAGKENLGTYIDNYEPDEYTNAIITNPKLNKFCNPIYSFSNCEMGIEKIISKYYSIELTAVTYE